MNGTGANVLIKFTGDTKDVQSKMTGLNKTMGAVTKGFVAGSIITKGLSTAFRMVTDSTDGAIKRLDTMNNFPKVMSNLGISAKDSEKTINKLNEKLKGLPTSIDSAALSVQRLTAKNGNIKKSTNLFLAMNNAILAGGASTEQQATAMEQLTQAYSKGKPDMMEWRALQSTMPAQLKQIAIAMGYTNEALLGEAVRAKGGEKEFRRMMNTMVKMNKTGVKGFKSFEKQARNSTDGIQTALANMRTAITRGLANAFKSADKALKKANMGGISKVISNIGTSFENALKKISKWIETLPLEKIFNTLKKIAPIVASVLAGILAFKSVVKIISIIKGLMTAFSALSAVMMANPITAVIAGVAALAAGLYVLSRASTSAKSETDKSNEALKNYSNSMKEAKQAKQEYLNENMGEISHYQNLYRELQGLVNANGKVKKGYEERAKFIVSTLNEALGTEIKITNGVIQNYGKLSKSIQDVINKKRTEVVLEAHKKEYEEAIKQENKLYSTYANQLQEVKTIEENRKKSLNDIAKALNVNVNELNKFIDANGNIDTAGIENYIDKIYFLDRSVDPQKALSAMNNYRSLNSELSSAQATLDKSRVSWQNNTKTIYDYEKAVTFAQQGNYTSLNKMWNDTYSFEGKTTTATINNINKRIAAEQDYINKVKTGKYSADQDYVNSETQKHQKVIAELEKSKKQYQTATQGQQAHIKGIWNQGMRDLVKDISGKDVQFKQAANGNIQAYVNGEAQGKPMAQAQARSVTQGIIKELNKGKSQGKIAGINTIQGVENGINYKKGSAYSTIASFGRTLLSKLKASLKEKSPSKATAEMGGYLVEGISVGMKDNVSSATKQAETVGNSIMQAFKSLFQISSPSKWAKVTIGGNIVLGIAKGMADKKHRVAVRQACENLSKDVQQKLKGSKTNYKKIGKLLGSEFATGITESLSKVRDAANKIKETLTNVTLTTTEDDKTKLTDLGAIKKQVIQYGKNLAKLKGVIPESLYKEVLGMDREQGLAYTNELLKLDGRALKTYISNWNAIQTQASKISNDYYETEAAKQAKKLSKTYSSKLNKELSSLDKLMGGLGKKASKGLINGLLSQTKGLDGAAKTIADTIIKSVKKKLKIKSPSRVMMGLGKYTTEGFIEGITSMQRELDSIMNSTFGLSPTVTGTASTHFSPEVKVTVQNNMKTDPLGQVVNNVKTFSGGAKNDYNYGIGG